MIIVKECSKCGRTETARWYRKTSSNPICCSCYRKEYVSKNQEKVRKLTKKFNDKDEYKQARDTYAKSEIGKKKRRELDKKRYWTNPDKFRSKNDSEAQRERLRRHYQENKSYYVEKSSRRSRNLDNASLSNAYKEQTIEIYNTCPEGYEVDHIIPINGYDFLNGKRQKVVCGLHVPWNLQHLKKEENRSKSCNLYSLD